MRRNYIKIIIFILLSINCNENKTKDVDIPCYFAKLVSGSTAYYMIQIEKDSFMLMDNHWIDLCNDSIRIKHQSTISDIQKFGKKTKIDKYYVDSMDFDSFVYINNLFCSNLNTYLITNDSIICNFVSCGELSIKKEINRIQPQKLEIFRYFLAYCIQAYSNSPLLQNGDLSGDMINIKYKNKQWITLFLPNNYSDRFLILNFISQLYNSASN